MTERSWI